MFLANEPESSIEYDLLNCVCEASFLTQSAIDGFEAQQRWIVRRAFEFSLDIFELGMLVMALTSATETYFRTVLAGAVTACPICHDNNVEKGKISMRAVAYYPLSMLPLSLLEHVSFSDSDAIRKQSLELLQIEVPKTDKGSSSIAAAMQHYDKVCALRHALIHSAGIINSQNCAQAGIKGPLRAIQISLGGLQMIADICRNAVLAYNQFIFESLMARLYKNKILNGNHQAERATLDSLIRLFLSKNSPDYSEDFGAIRIAIHQEFGIKP